MNFNKKNVLITGASSGIGRAIAVKLARHDCNLILTARRTDPLNEIKNNSGNKARIEIFKCDVSKIDEVKNTYEQIKNIFGLIDIAILNAGTGIYITPETFNSSAAEEVFGANFFGVVYWTEMLLPGFMKRKEGMLVGISSLADNRAYATTFYNPSKAALTVFLEGLRLDMKKYNVKVLTVKPGFVKTPMTDRNNFKMPFLITADKASNIILKGIEREKKIIQFPFQTVLLTRIIGLLSQSVYEFLMGSLNK